MNGFSTEEDSREGPPAAPAAPGCGQSCCLIADGERCARPAGNASFSKRVQKSISQKKLKLDIDRSVRHLYICDFHKSFIQSVRGKRKRRASDEGGDSPERDTDVPEAQPKAAGGSGARRPRPSLCCQALRRLLQGACRGSPPPQAWCPLRVLAFLAQAPTTSSAPPSSLQAHHVPPGAPPGLPPLPPPGLSPSAPECRGPSLPLCARLSVLGLPPLAVHLRPAAWPGLGATAAVSLGDRPPARTPLLLCAQQPALVAGPGLAWAPRPARLEQSPGQRPARPRPPLSPQVDLSQLQASALQRYKRRYKLQTRPGSGKAQLAETVSRHFRNIPVNEKETLACFIYMVKSNKSRLDPKPEGGKQLE
ncbi:Histone deacetylase complex subunit SAP30L [Galemys pyrenaicus]|uniref:Histone deacetylase complex subunit SAP30L n=1 Tax=Galemys pyrenaicus TaxID=202257 RepID=A0A8J6DK94_GALPY|nr:Histone deacetylase complex subunit SAP30L [Galemys pyrenaicus]